MREQWSPGFIVAVAIFACGIAVGTVGTAIQFSPFDAIETVGKTQNIFAAGVAFIAAVIAYRVQKAKIVSDEAARESETQARSIALAYRIEWVSRSLASCSKIVVESEAGVKLHVIWTRGFSRRCHNGIAQGKATHAEIWAEINRAHLGTIEQLVQRLGTMDAMVLLAEELCEMLDGKPEEALRGELFEVDSTALHILVGMERMAPGFAAEGTPARPDNVARFLESIGRTAVQAPA